MSANYKVCFSAVQKKCGLTFIYDELPREVSPHVLGHTKGQEKLLGHQSGGATSKGRVPAGGQWKCFTVGKMNDLKVADLGRWTSGSSHTQRHSCIEEVDIDINPEAPQKYRWKRPSRPKKKKPRTR